MNQFVEGDLDPQFYGSFYGDLAGLSPVELRAHWRNYGSAEGRHPTLDAWLDANDLARSELPVDFAEDEYLLLNPDVPREPPGIAIRHYLLHGRRERRYHRFDEAFYSGIYPDLRHLTSREAALAHWFSNGLGEQRMPTLDAWLHASNMPSPFSCEIDLRALHARNPHADFSSVQQLKMALLFAAPVPNIEVSAIASENASLYAGLGVFRLVNGEADAAENCFRAALQYGGDPVAHEHLGNIATQRGQHRLAIYHYNEALRHNPRAAWATINLGKALLGERRLEDTLDLLRRALTANPGSALLALQFHELIQQYWALRSEQFDELIMRDSRAELIQVVGSACTEIARVYQLLMQGPGGEPALADLSHRRVLIVGDFHVPQCVRYRIEQKCEQLQLAGYTSEAISWTQSESAFAAIPWHDVVIFYRVPAFPQVILLIEYARALGKLVVYEIDDLVFDPLYPPSPQSYGGSVGPLLYADLSRGMALFRAAATLCDYAVASTEPLLEHLLPLVRRGRGFVHRNALDSNNDLREPPAAHAGQRIRLFYGSGTLAHNSDFIEEALPALQRILSNYPAVQLMIVGHLRLPAEFLQRFRDQVIQVPLLKNVRAYLDCLSQADINLAVLRQDTINDCKSELKWVEAACYAIPSIVSPTRNYREVIRDGVDGFLAVGEERWYQCLQQLIVDQDLRRRIGAAARARAQRDYSLECHAASLGSQIAILIDHHNAVVSGSRDADKRNDRACA